MRNPFAKTDTYSARICFLETWYFFPVLSVGRLSGFTGTSHILLPINTFLLAFILLSSLILHRLCLGQRLHHAWLYVKIREPFPYSVAEAILLPLPKSFGMAWRGRISGKEQAFFQRVGKIEYQIWDCRKTCRTWLEEFNITCVCLGRYSIPRKAHVCVCLRP